MNDVRKRQVIERRLQLLRGHIDRVGSSEGFDRELQRTAAQLRELEQPRPSEKVSTVRPR